jgi:hypothetical protein
MAANSANFDYSLRYKFEQQCPECRESELVEDHSSGDLICKVGYLKGRHLCWKSGDWPKLISSMLRCA